MKMALSTPADQARHCAMLRFDPSRWVVNFPRPMMAALTTQSGDGLDVWLDFKTQGDLAGLIWDSVDGNSHPLLAYETQRDYRGLTLSFFWQATGGLKALDAVDGPTLTLEGRDVDGMARHWFVRLWNYAQGTPLAAQITLDFDALEGGFVLPEDADPVWAGAIDRLFISLPPQDYAAHSTTPLDASTMSAHVALRAIKVDGARAVLRCGDACLPEHDIGMAGGYDDIYHVTPEHVVRQCVALGYRGSVDHYIGMSHAMQLVWDAQEQRFIVHTPPEARVKDAINIPAQRWHADFFDRLKAYGLDVLISLSYELFEAYCPDAWRQRAFDGSPGRTGWVPPSNLLAPTNGAAMTYLQRVALAFCALVDEAGLGIRFQVGEPWWWVPETVGGQMGAPCLYDSQTQQRYTQETGENVPTPLQTLAGNLSAAHLAYLDWCSAKLGQSVLAITQQVRAHYTTAETTLLIYLPQIVLADHPNFARLNLPEAWAKPAYPILQIEDYGFVTTKNWAAHTQARQQVQARLGYTPQETDYFSGFVLNAQDKAQWQPIFEALARTAGYRRRYLWAYPQIIRDGVVFTKEDSEAMQGFHDVRYPLTLGFGSSGGPEFSTNVVMTASGQETRTIGWRQARRRYEVGSGIRSEEDLSVLLAFFESRQGRAYAFRFQDPLDYSSAPYGKMPTPTDQLLEVGDGITTQFELVKRYGAAVRRITKPVAASVLVAVGGRPVVPVHIDALLGRVELAEPPPVGARVTAGFLFDVPVRFEEDRLNISTQSFAAGEAPDVTLIEVINA
jgi:uncharacterized protein (TIGR02217 family)